MSLYVFYVKLVNERDPFSASIPPTLSPEDTIQLLDHKSGLFSPSYPLPHCPHFNEVQLSGFFMGSRRGPQQLLSTSLSS